MNINDALYHAVHEYEGGVATLAVRMGLGSSTLYSMANTNDPTHGWPLSRVMQVIAFTRDQRVIQSLAEAAGGVFVPVPQGSGPMPDVAERMLKLSAEFGDVAREVNDSVRDGHLTPRERDRVAKQLYELIAAAAELGQGLDAQVTAAVPVRAVK